MSPKQQIFQNISKRGVFMRRFKIKSKNIFSFLFLLIIFFTVSTNSSTRVFSVDDNIGIMRSYTLNSFDDYHAYKSNVISVTFLDEIDYDAINAADTIGYWDVSELTDGSVIAWMKLNKKETKNADTNRYDVYIGGKNNVKINSNSSYLFANFTSLKEINGLNNITTNNVTDTRYMFYNCSSLTELDLSDFNTDNLVYSAYMFRDCSSLKIIDLSNWDTRKFTNASFTSSMFTGCSNLTLNAYNIILTDYGMQKFFSGKTSFETINLSIANIDTITTMENMFNNCRNLVTLNLYSISTKNITNMENMFWYCESLKTINSLKDFDTSNVTNMRSMFYKCSSLEMLDLSNFNTKKVTDISYMFACCFNLSTIYVGSDWTIENIVSGTGTFSECSKLKGKTNYDIWKDNYECATINDYMTPIDNSVIPPVIDNEKFEQPDTEQKLSFFEKLIKWIKDFFAKIFNF